MERADIPLFRGIVPEELDALLACLGAYERSYAKGETLVREGDDVADIGVLLQGYARSVRVLKPGVAETDTLLAPGSLIGVLLAASRTRRSPVTVTATGAARVLYLPFERVVTHCERDCDKHRMLLRNVLDGIANTALAMHDRTDCLTRRSVREKVMLYLTRLGREQGSTRVIVPLDRQGLADYLCVDRTALSRELSAMRRDGLIAFERNRFTLQDPMDCERRSEA